MTLTAAGFPGSVNDLRWSEMSDMFGNDSVLAMTVSAAAGDRNVTVGTGRAWGAGVLATMTVAETFNFPANGSSNPRRDLLVVEATWSDRQTRLLRLPGTPNATPQVPWSQMVRTPGVKYHVPLATVQIDPGQGALSAGDITRVAPPPPTDFYFINSINTAPHPDLNALVYYAPGQRLMVPDNGEYVTIARAQGPEIFTAPDATFPKVVTANNTPLISNQITVPSAAYGRYLTIDATHYVFTFDGSEGLDSVLLLGASSTPVDRWRHPRDTVINQASSGHLHTVHYLPANQSLAVKVGMVRSASTGSGNTSSSAQYNNMKILAIPE